MNTILTRLKPYRPALIVLGVATVFLITYALLRGKKAVPGEGAPLPGATTGSPNAPQNSGLHGSIVRSAMTIRNDARGLGHYGAPRSPYPRTHAGLDIRAYEGQPVLAPFAGTLTRNYNAYNWSTKWRGLELISDDGSTKLKVMYCLAVAGLVGRRVVSGQQIGTAQAISGQYGGGMLDHLHVELYKSGNRVDPAGWFALG